MDKQYLSRPETVRVTLSDEVVAHVLWHFGERWYGREPGSFTKHLLRAFGASDRENRAKLTEAFPEYGTAFELAALQTWGMGYLLCLAKGAEADAQNQLAFPAEDAA